MTSAIGPKLSGATVVRGPQTLVGAALGGVALSLEETGALILFGLS